MYDKKCPVCSQPLNVVEEFVSTYLYSQRADCNCGYRYYYLQGDTKEELGIFSFVSTYDGEYFRNYPISFEFLSTIFYIRYRINKLLVYCCSHTLNNFKKFINDIVNFN